MYYCEIIDINKEIISVFWKCKLAKQLRVNVLNNVHLVTKFWMFHVIFGFLWSRMLNILLATPPVII